MSHTDARYRFEEISPIAESVLLCIFKIAFTASLWNTQALNFRENLHNNPAYMTDTLNLLTDADSSTDTIQLVSVFCVFFVGRG